MNPQQAKDQREIRSHEDEALDEALGDLQEAAQGAIVPGELRPWLEDVRERQEGVSRELERHGEREERLLERMDSEDLELAPRVDRLREVAGELQQRLEWWVRSLRSLLEEDRARGSGSAEPVGRAEELRREVLEWVVDFRAHRGELRTWLQESVQRDRGVVD